MESTAYQKLHLLQIFINTVPEILRILETLAQQSIIYNRFFFVAYLGKYANLIILIMLINKRHT